MTLPWQCSPAGGPAGSNRHVARFALTVLGAALSCSGAAVAAQTGSSPLSVSHAWVRSIMASRPAAGYFTLSNASGTPRELVGAASPDCGMLMLHRTIRASGVDRMVMVKSVTVPAHGAAQFAPGGYHLMCEMPSPTVTRGHSIPVTLRFEDGTSLTTAFPVRGASGK